MATILIVEDSQTERQVLRKMLEKGGHLVIAATDGVEGKAMARQNNPDLILMDVVMPGMNGFQATRKLTRDPDTADIPIIMITSRTGDKHRDRALELGVKRYLGKPYQEADLLENIYTVLADSAL